VARKLGISYNRAQDLLIEHKRGSPRVWAWSEEQVRLGFVHKRIVTRWGWYMTVTRDTSRRTLQNFPVQGLAADILRLAHLLLMENGVAVCGPIHDAFLCEAVEEDAEATKVKVKQVMEEAGRIVLGAGTILRADVETIAYPERWLDRQRGGAMWDKIMGAINRLSAVDRQVPV
jgi:DNA polymerase-1